MVRLSPPLPEGGNRVTGPRPVPKMGIMTTLIISVDSWRERTEVRRAEDDELLGFLVADGGRVLPTTVFGTPLAEAGSEDQGRELLTSLGLDYLTDPWLMRRDEDEIQVRVVEADPTRVTVQNHDYGSGLDMNTRFTITAPAASLRRA